MVNTANAWSVITSSMGTGSDSKSQYYYAWPVRNGTLVTKAIIGVNKYSTINAAIGTLSADTVLKLLNYELTEDIYCNIGTTITLQGGYDSTFTSVNGYTVIKGILVIRQCSVIADNIVIM
jgi:hypothetical protein